MPRSITDMKNATMGIRGTLLVAFAIVWGFVLLASVTAIYALSEINGIVDDMTRKRASAIVESSQLARQVQRAVAGAITAARPISTVMNPSLFLKQVEEVRQAEAQLAASLEVMRSRQTPEATALQGLAETVRKTIDDLVATTQSRLEAHTALASVLSDAAGANLIFQQAAEPQRRIFGSIVANTAQRGAKVAQPELLHALGATYSFDRMQLAFSTVYLTLINAAQSASITDLNLQVVVLRRELANLRQTVAGLSPGMDNVSHAALRIAQLAEAPNSAIVQRRQELKLLVRSSQLLDQIGATSQQLLDRIDTLIGQDNMALKTGAHYAAAVADINTRRMIQVIIASLICSALMVWLYVFRNLAGRLNRVKTSMLQLADGKLDIGLPKESADEVGRMAGALRVFRATAQEAEQRERTLAKAKIEAETALEQLTQVQESLVRSEKLASLGQLVAGIAHEVNTPIGNALTAATQGAEETVRIERLIASGALRRSDLAQHFETVRELSDILMRNCLRASQLIRDFKQVAADQASGQRRRFDLGKHLQETLHTLQHRFSRAGVALISDTPEGMTMDSFPGFLSQVVINLAENALSHAFAESGRTHGELRLTASAPAPDRVEIVVSDNGKGIAPNVMPKIFDPFFTTNRGAGNTGLGLHIIHNLMTGPLGGEIRVESEPERGTRFILSLPRVAVAADHPEPGEELPA